MEEKYNTYHLLKQLTYCQHAEKTFNYFYLYQILIYIYSFFFANRILIFIINSYYNFLTISLRLLLYTACLPHHSFNFYLESVCYFVVFPLFFPCPKVKHNNTISMTLERENRRNEKAKQAR